MSALPPKADIRQPEWHVRYVPIADVSATPKRLLSKPGSQVNAQIIAIKGVRCPTTTLATSGVDGYVRPWRRQNLIPNTGTKMHKGPPPIKRGPCSSSSKSSRSLPFHCRSNTSCLQAGHCHRNGNGPKPGDVVQLTLADLRMTAVAVQSDGTCVPSSRNQVREAPAQLVQHSGSRQRSTMQIRDHFSSNRARRKRWNMGKNARADKKSLVCFFNS